MSKRSEKFNKGEIIIYQPKTGGPRLEVALEQETVWLTQLQLAHIFDVQKAAISKHVKNIFDSGELDKKSTVSKMETVQIEAGRAIKRAIEYYNLDLILSIFLSINKFLC